MSPLAYTAILTTINWITGRCIQTLLLLSSAPGKTKQIEGNLAPLRQQNRNKRLEPRRVGVVERAAVEESKSLNLAVTYSLIE